MSFSPARPYDRASTGGDGSVNAAVRVRASDGAVGVVFALRVKAQEAFFGESVAGRRVAVDIGRGADHGKVRFRLAEEGVAVGNLPKGAVAVRVAGWDLIAPGAHKSAPMRFVERDEAGCVFELPEWGQRGVAQERLSHEFGLKPIARKEP